MSAPVAMLQVKGVRDAPSPPTYGPHWSLSRRGRLKVFDDRLELGSWRVPHAAVEEAVLWQSRTQIGAKASIFEVKTGEHSYQFGMNPWAELPRTLPYRVEERENEMTYTAYSWIIRLAMIAVVVWFVTRIVLP